MNGHFFITARANRAGNSLLSLYLHVLQLSGRLAGYVKESGNDSPIPDLQMAADRTRSSAAFRRFCERET
jgi:hypothetical protein